MLLKDNVTLLVTFYSYCTRSLTRLEPKIHSSQVLNLKSYTYRIRQNFRGGKLSRLCTKHTIHWKTFVVHQAHAIMYCTQQMIQGENFRDWLKNRESFPLESFAVYGNLCLVYSKNSYLSRSVLFVTTKSS